MLVAICWLQHVGFNNNNKNNNNMLVTTCLLQHVGCISNNSNNNNNNILLATYWLQHIGYNNNNNKNNNNNNSNNNSNNKDSNVTITRLVSVKMRKSITRPSLLKFHHFFLTIMQRTCLLVLKKIQDFSTSSLKQTI